MKMKKNKLVNLFKMGLLLFGMSVLLLNCEKENGIEPQEITSQNRFEKSFNKDDFKKTIPFSYEVNWEGIVKKYSEELETNFYEFDLIYDTPFNPTTINNLKKEGYNISYKLIVTESEENKLDFFVAKFFQKKDGVTKIEDLNISLNKSSDYEGLTHLYDTNNELYFAKKINEKEIKEPKLYFKDKVKEDNSGLYARGDVTTCTTSTLYHYIDWYRYTYDAWGNLISIVYLYTEYVGSSSTTSCTTEFQPDEPIRIIRGEGDGYLDCLDGSGRRNCAKAAEPRIMCQVGFQPDENGDCVEVKKLSLDDLDDSFTFSDALGLTDEQENWINDIRNKEAKDAITNYLNSFTFTPEFENAKIFAKDYIILLLLDIDNLTNGKIEKNFNFNQDYKTMMSISERALFENLDRTKQLLYLQSAFNAKTLTNSLYPPSVNNPCSLHNGQGDAFRHAVWNALSTVRIGKTLTNQLTTAHEDQPIPTGYTAFQYNKEKQMDLYNNAKGQQLAYTAGLVVDAVKNAKENGSLKYLSNLNSTNCLRLCFRIMWNH